MLDLRELYFVIFCIDFLYLYDKKEAKENWPSIKQG